MLYAPVTYNLPFQCGSYVAVCSVALSNFIFIKVDLKYVHIILSSVKVAEWLPFGLKAAPSVNHMFSLMDVNNLLFSLFLILVSTAGVCF